ncbi:2-isopropylmalate synthase [Megasphaera cerevisiae DSM 20462]|jgi:2-isopropylmalate synthase|uniref:2-isopropylmalate synthase n=1 Tax=Megasphaera cerevisiae DSM 20462 TaxID=1122219 RepID=A0A0J6WUT0_9FIRM|nr:2-isopropylmalate synthase [Megasphaera cerevisiae]KMO85943.1 2-isopropylmalate synthase [Megasphaera cerevisiae DSM 20462]MCI1750041.1 2-isopropylmalate synthase [Megasphaera cerevisiae]SJZ98722.1 2-isopropylmalate synthase [Megasphaera cerevisiae DSM 20462]
MKNVEHYKKGYYMPPVVDMSWAQKECTDKAPTWCSVDLRDGNQALIIPMSLDEKIEFYKTLVHMGFKEIEVGFPAASETEYEFLRTLVEQDLIPDDVTVQVLTQAREHIIRKTFKALEGVKNAIVHVYNSTSVAQRQQVFHKSRAEIKKIAVDGARLLRDLTIEAGANYRFEYSPESFTGTEPEFALEVCNAVLDVWQPTRDRKAIINLPSTVQMSMSHIYASQIAFLSQHLKYRENVVLSLHPHNDRGCGVADAEMGLLAGADRIEGTLFGNGERTGNADIVTIGMNMFALGIDPELDFSHMPELIDMYERVTRMEVHPRQPYAGKLVFAAFSGSHQDAIAKGMKFREERDEAYWTVPYLYIDPHDVGRRYEADVIRINSQSGKGGVGFIMEQKYDVNMPKKMREDFSYFVKEVSDHKHQELKPAEIYQIFSQYYVNTKDPIRLENFSLQKRADRWLGQILLQANGEEVILQGQGNGQLNAVSNAICKAYGITITNLVYSEHDLDRDSGSRGIAYFGLTDTNGKTTWGAGIDTDTITASIMAFVTAINRMEGMTERVRFRALKSSPAEVGQFRASVGQH